LSLRAIRILLVDDSDSVRQALCSLLSAHVEFAIVCQSINGSAAISKTAELQPDVILLDISLPDMNGLEVARQMKSAAPSAEILLLSEHDLLPMVQEGLRAGARGYVLKSDAPHELAAAIRQVHKKEQYVGLRFAQ
jgi:DNA-binding NarL/FixJ family response regulator